MATPNQTSRTPKSSSARKRRLAAREQRALNFQTLEDRRLLAAVTVGNATDIVSPTADTSSVAALLANDGGDGISLREAIAAANSTTGLDTITFDTSVFTGGTASLIRLTQGELEITDTLTIDASTATAVTITGDANDDDVTDTANITDVTASGAQFLDDNSRVFNFSITSGDLALAGLTVTGGRSGLGNQDGLNGGGIYFASNGNLSLINSTLSGNSTSDGERGGDGMDGGNTGDGGGIFSKGAVSLIGSTVSMNATGRGGDGGIGGDVGEPGGGKGGDGGNGGGIFSQGAVSLTDSTVSGNTSGDAGRGGFSGYRLCLQNCGPGGYGGYGGYSTYSENGGNGGDGGNGGGIFSHAAVSLIGSTVSGNLAGDAGSAFFGGDDGESGDGGGIWSDIGGVTLSNSAVSGNTTGYGPDGGDGGGIWSFNGGVSLSNSTVSGNTTGDGGGGGLPDTNGDSGDGGGIWSHQGGVTLTNSTVSGNTTGQGGYGGYEGGNSGDGGGIWSANGVVTLTDSTVIENSTGEGAGLGLGGTSAGSSGAGGHGGDGGGIFSQGAVTLTDSIVSRNTTGNGGSGAGGGGGGSGGGIFAQGGASLTNSTVSGNTTGASGIGYSGYSYGGGSGGGIFSQTAVTLTNSNVSGNTAGEGEGNSGYSSSGGGNSGNGGGIFSQGAVTLTDSTVAGNTTGPRSYYGNFGYGGGIAAGAVTLTNSTVSGNSTGVGGDGGGILTGSGSVTLINSTVSGNTTGGGGFVGYAGHGGGIWTNSGAVTLTNSTLTGNEAGGSGGGILSNAAITIENSIVAGNTDNGGTLYGPTLNDLVAGPNSVLTVNYSLIGVADNITQAINGNVGNQTGTTTSPLDPLLAPLTNNGGPTQTHALLVGSPAIDAGNSTESLDQRGMTRVVDLAGVPNAATSNGADIGAFERQVTEPLSEPPVVTSFTRDEGGVLARPDLLSTIAVEFNVDVNVNASDLQIQNDSSGGSAVELSNLIFSYDALTKIATWDFSNLALVPAFYSFELSDDIVSVADNLSLDGDEDGNPGIGYFEPIYVALPGDANLDGQVDVLNDAFVLVGNLNTTTNFAWADGNFNGDGQVDVLNDAFTLVGNLGRDVRPPMNAAPLSTVQSPSASTATSSPAITAFPLEDSNGDDEHDDSFNDANPSSAQSESLQLVLAGDHDLRDDVFGSEF